MTRKPWTEQQWLILALPISFISIAASAAPKTLLAMLDPIERASALLSLAILAGMSLIGAMTDELTEE
jgi:hypothetical protein